MPPLNQELINAFRVTLNTGRSDDNPLWVEIIDTYAVIQMNIGLNGVITFDGNRGFPLKVFKNTETQELKMFDARKFVLLG